jgi:hypothetical protein
MKQFVLIFLVCATSLIAQDVPFYWPSESGGTQISVTNFMRFDAEAISIEDGSMLISWVDARPGNGSVIVQKYSTTNFEDPGMWHADIQLGEQIDGMVLPAGTGSSILPNLCSDGQGGAFVCWNDVVQEGVSSLFVNHISEEPAGNATISWTQNVSLSDNAWVYYEGCRSSRCRSSMLDMAKKMCPDGNGGAWISWLDTQASLYLNHISSDGSINSAFSANGLLVSENTRLNFSLCADSQGNAVLGWSAGATNLPMIQGFSPEGEPVNADGPVVLSNNSAYTRNIELARCGDQISAIWTSYDDEIYGDPIDMQIFNSDLEFLLEENGQRLGVADSYHSVDLQYNELNQSIYVAYLLSGSVYIQCLNAQGNANWPAAKQLNSVVEDGNLMLLSMNTSSSGLYCLLEDYSSAGSQFYALLMDDHGSEMWTAEQGYLGTGLAGFSPAVSVSSGDGLYCAWMCVNRDSEKSELYIQRKTNNSTNQISAESSLRQQSGLGGQYAISALSSEHDYFTFWLNYGKVHMQRTDAETGMKQFGISGLKLDLFDSDCVPYDNGYAVTMDSDGYIWMVVSLYDSTYNECLHLLKLDAEGQVLSGPTYIPSEEDAGLIYQRQQGFKFANDRLYLVYSELGVNSINLKAQAFDLDANMLWGASGIILDNTGYSGNIEKVEFEPLANGGLDVFWSLSINYAPSAANHFQRLSSDGILLQQSSELDIGDSYYSGSDKLDIVHLDNQSTILAISQQGYSIDEGGYLNRLDLVLLDPDLNIIGEENVCNDFGTAYTVDIDEDNIIWISSIRRIENSYSLHMSKYESNLDHISDCKIEELPQLGYMDLLTVKTNSGLQVILTQVEYTNEVNRLRCLVADAGNALSGQHTEYHAELDQSQAYIRINSVVADNHGGFYVTWQNHKNQINGYGDAIFATRICENSVSVDLPNSLSPDKFELHQNFPNPFNPQTWIEFDLNIKTDVVLEVFNLNGRLISVLINEELRSGNHKVLFDAGTSDNPTLGSGVYFYKLSTPEYSSTKRMLLIK